MKQIPVDEVRESRITMEIVVDAYNEEEQAMGWYCYLEDTLQFPFKAKCIMKKATSPLKEGDVVEVSGMASDEECQHNMLVEIKWKGRNLAVQLSQLVGIAVNEKTKEAIEDWHYWLARGYEF